MQSGRRLTDLEPAGLARRTSALAIDCALVFVVLALLLQLLFDGSTNQVHDRDTGLLVYALVLSWAPVFLYFALFESRGRHATPGKRLLRIDVASIAMPRVSFARALLRTIVKLSPIVVAQVFVAASAARFVDPATGAVTIPALDALGAGVLGGLLLALVLLGVLLFSVMLHPDGRGAHDMLAGTFVVRSVSDAVPGASPTHEAPVR